MQVKQVVNLFELLELFIRARQPLSVREIVDELGWPRSSTFNMVSTLMELGYLYQPVTRGGYYPTSRWMDVARQLSEAQPLPESVHELLVDLMKRTGETLVLAAPDGAEAVFLDVVESPEVIRYTASVGQRVPIQVTSVGRAILAQYAPSERAALLKRISYQPYESGAYLTPEAVEEDIRRHQSKGWFLNRAHFVAGLAGVAVPFPFRNRRNAIVLGAPLARVEQRMDELGKMLRDSVQAFLQDNSHL